MSDRSPSRPAPKAPDIPEGRLSGRARHRPRRPLQWLASLFLLLVLALAYIAHAESEAESRARDFCATVRPGDGTDGLAEKAWAAGADRRMTRWLKSPGAADWLPVTFTGLFPYSRHLCSIEAAAKQVTKAEYGYLD